MAEKLGESGMYVQPGYNRFELDDGSDHDHVTKIYVMGSNAIEVIKVDYIKDGKRKDGSFHGTTESGYLQMFEIDHLNNEYLESVEFYLKSYNFIHGIQFKTNLRVSQIMGYTYGDKFTLASHGKKIIGFHGVGKDYSQALGAYVTPVTPKRMEAEGGKQGKEWDDGANHEAITKIHVRTSFHEIQYISFDYVDMYGHQKEGPHHGSSSHGGFTLEPFEINHLDKEYLLSVDGYYDKKGVIKALQFKTNVKASEPIEYDDEEGTKFTLGCKGMEIIGFHGTADEKLNSLGVYLKTLPLTKLEFKGGERGTMWDDGTFNGVRKVSVYYDSYYVRCITFEYDNGGKVLSRQHGSKLEYSREEGEVRIS